MKPAKIAWVLACLWLAAVAAGQVNEADRKKAEEIKVNAERGDAKAQFNLGLLYYKGEGVPKDAAEAVKWWRKAAGQGFAEAEYSLGVMHYHGEGVPKDAAVAVQWYRKAADRSNAAAQFNLGVMYENGEGVPKDAAEAMKWYRKSADRGDAQAQFSLGIKYAKGEGVPKDAPEAVKWWRKAAGQGNAAAQNNLGLMYAKGDGIPKDAAEAEKWWREAAGQGVAEAQNNLGVMYRNGKGVPKDAAEAVKWFRRAAHQGHAAAQLNLGIMSAQGEGVPKDDVEAYKWLNLAAAGGNENAAKARVFVERDMSREEITEAQRRSRAFVPRTEKYADNFGPDRLQAFSDRSQPAPKLTGSGFFLSADGFLLSNYHVVEGADRIIVRTKSGLLPAKLVRSDAANDLALLKVTGSFTGLPVASSRGVKLGDAVFTVGFPNVQVQGFAPKLTKGEINSLAGAQDDVRHFQISVAVQPGNSGGPLLNSYGNVVGIVTARLSDAAGLLTSGALPQNVNYALKSSYAQLFLESVPELAGKLKEPNTRELKFEEVVSTAEKAAVLVLVY